MPEIENPYQDINGAKPVPGIIEQQYASTIEVFLRLFGVTLYQHEHDGLAAFIGAFLRAWPSLKDFAKPKI